MIWLGLTLTAATGTCVALSLRLRSLPAFLLAAYVVSIADVVGVIEVLSPGRDVSARNVLVAQATLLAVAGGLALRRGSLPARPVGVGALLRAQPLLVLLGAIVAPALAYQLALAVGTPPNNWDSMAYHLSRAAAWRSQHGVAYVDSHTARENAFQPNAEMLVLYTLVLDHRDRFAAVWQWLAEPASLLAIFMLARRIGRSQAEAAFAALTFACLSEVALQSTTTQNDLLVASLAVACAAFLACSETPRAWLAALAFGLAIGTKLTVAFAVPALALIVAATFGRRAWRALTVPTGLAVAAFGAYGYVLNLVHTGSLLGAASATNGRGQGSLIGFARTIGGVLAEIGLDLRVLPHFPADEDLSFFGPLGIVLLIPVLVLGLRRIRSGTRLQQALALAFPIYLVALACAYNFNIFVGRYMLTAVALLAPLFAGAYRMRRYSAFVVAIGGLSLASTLLFDHAKPSGIGDAPSVWTMSRPVEQSLQRPAMLPVLKALDACVPSDARIGFMLGEDDWDYPLYGGGLSRRLVNLHGDGKRLESLDWALVRPGSLRRPDGWLGTTYPGADLSLIRSAAASVTTACANMLAAQGASR